MECVCGGLCTSLPVPQCLPEPPALTLSECCQPNRLLCPDTHLPSWRVGPPAPSSGFRWWAAGDGAAEPERMSRGALLCIFISLSMKVPISLGKHMQPNRHLIARKWSNAQVADRGNWLTLKPKGNPSNSCMTCRGWQRTREPERDSAKKWI